jgi:hypothetical protein
VLGTGETCTGDSARRAGNEFLFQQLAAQNVETINELFEGVETVDRKIIATCPHCFNTIGREYPQLGTNYTVLHHTQLLNRLIRDKKLVPVSPVSQDVTYHDPCFLGRHNKVYEPPRELVEASGATLKEMPRHADRGLCCGAGGARMWMEEHIGKRVNHERVEEALDTGASKIATGCPFCRVMMTDGVDDVAAARDVEKTEVLDVAQLLLASLDKSSVTLPAKGAAAEAAAARAEEAAAKAETAPAEAKPSTDDEDDEAKPAAAGDAEADAKPVTGLGLAGGAKRPGAKKAAAPAAETPAAAPAPVKGLGIAGGAKRPGAKKAAAPAAESAAPAAESAPAAPAEATPAAPAKPEPEVKGLGIASGARRPGAKKAAPAAAPAAESAPAAPAETAPAAPAKPEPEVKGLGIAAGARRPGAKKAPAAAPAATPAAKPAEPEAEPEPEPIETASANGESAEPAKPEPPVVGLGIKPGARRPGKR